MNYSIRNIVIAGGLALLAVILFVIYGQNVEKSAETKASYVWVASAVKDIPAGTTLAAALSSGQINQAKVIQQYAVPSYVPVKDGKVLDAFKVYDGQVLNRSYEAGEQISTKSIGEESAAAPTIRIDKTERLMQISINNDDGLVGSLSDGDHVDVIGILSFQDAKTGNAGTLIRPILRDVEIVSIAPGNASKGALTGGAGDGSQLISLKLTDNDINKMVFLASGTNGTKFWLALRPQGGRARNSKIYGVETLATMVFDGLGAAQKKRLATNTGIKG